MEKTFKDKLLEGLDKALKFSKKNYLSFVVILLTILIFVFLVLPAATVNVTNLAYASNQERYTLESITSGTQTYRLSDILFGVNVQSIAGLFTHTDLSQTPNVVTTGVAHSFGVVFFPNNTFVGTGLLLFVAAAVLMLFPKLIIRTVGASLSLIAAFLMIFIYFNVMYEIPITQNFLTIEYSMEYLAGPIVLLILGFLTSGVAIYITVMDYLADFRHRQEEKQRYLRGGV
ncbi:MAG: hypothetical protein WC282_03475 [Bacilli bacterium]|jgi:uncharacterized integral membrane protein